MRYEENKIKKCQNSVLLKSKKCQCGCAGTFRVPIVIGTR